MPILNPELVGRLDEAKDRIDEKKLDSFVEEMFNNLIQETIFYASIQDADNERRKDEVIRNFKKAWAFGKKAYQGEFTLELLTDVAGKVEPTLCAPGEGFAQLRNSVVTLQGIDYCPPTDEARIRKDLEQLFGALKEKELHPVEEAVFLYFHCARIQPLANANKRTASVVKNLTLSHHGFPTIHVTPDERFTYASLIKGAIAGFRKGTANGEEALKAYTEPDFLQRGFYDFLAKKVLDRLLIAEDVLNGLGRYEVDLKLRSPGQLYTTRDRIASWFEKQKRTYQIHLRRGEGKLEVVGDIPYDVLQCILKKGKDRGMTPKYGLRTITPEERS